MEKTSSAQGKSQAEKLRDNFFLTISCPVCLRYFQEPISLPSCEHTLCRECLKCIFENKRAHRRLDYLYEEDDDDDDDDDDYRNQTDQTIECPVCRRVNYVPSLSLLDLRQNAVIRQVVEMVQAHEKRTGTVSDDGNLLDRKREDTEHIANAAPASSPDDRCCHFLFPGMSTKNCPHCWNSFCEPCLFLHLERMKLKIGSIRCNLTGRRLEDATDDLDKAYVELAAELNEQVQEIEATVFERVDSLVDRIKAILYEKAHKITAQADSLRTELLANVAREISSGQHFDQKTFNDRVDQFLRLSVLESNPVEVTDLFSKASKREKQVESLELLNNFTHPEFITFAMELDATEKIEEFINTEVELGSVHSAARERARRPHRRSSSSQSAIDSAAVEVLVPAASDSLSIDNNGKAMTSTSSATEVIDSLKFSDVNITRPLRITSLPGSKFVLLTHDNFFATALRFLARKLIDVGSFRVVDPDRSNRKRKSFIPFGEEIAAEKNKVFVLDAQRRRIICFTVPWSTFVINHQTSTPNPPQQQETLVIFGARVKARNDNKFSGLAVNIDRHELYTICDGSLFTFCTINLSLAPKFTCAIAQNACLLFANDKLGVVYGVRGDERQIRVKFWQDGKNPADDGCSSDSDLSEIADNNLPQGFGGGTDFDSLGNIYLADFIGGCIKIYRQDATGSMAKCVSFVTEVSVMKQTAAENSAICDSSQVDKIKPHAISVISKTTANPDAQLLGVIIDAKSKSLLLLNFTKNPD